MQYHQYWASLYLLFPDKKHHITLDHLLKSREYSVKIFYQSPSFEVDEGKKIRLHLGKQVENISYRVNFILKYNIIDMKI